MFRRAVITLTCLSSFLAAPSFSKTVSVSGSTSVTHVMEVLAEQYNNEHKQDFIAVQGTGSSAGISLVEKGISEIGMSSRWLKPQEKSNTIKIVPIAFDGIAMVVNKDNPVQNLTKQQILDIYHGEITNWSQVGGPEREIAIVTREASSGSRYSFETLVGLTKQVNNEMVSDISDKVLVVNSNSMVKTIVNHNSHALGYISLGSIDNSIKALKFEGVEATGKNLQKGDYKFSRPFLLIHKNNKLSSVGQDFLHYVLSAEGQQTIKESGYVPVK
ncbi:phosphate ABC transporter substrate-binding protein [Vibrio sp. Of7-15]|uniref:phosphate ABC transporter substrate-binding protein n=1 Tax=Vibrio sp. Of7-15 TaxID=2724879 RepID=UPI001EF2B225|nr:phosphate ABC transporter substrate-binding protein [Vibrio sp. Of7-15]MCG7495527.1 phosphate ABC transporter substrate-binding protein [Vibrio sp. Of7-15]